VRTGAQGYVLKARLYSDLISAVHHALAGRIFAPSLTSMAAVAGSAHTVQFHTHIRDYIDELSRFVGRTLWSGASVVVAAANETRAGIAQRLEPDIDLAELTRRGQYIVMDAAEGLSQIMRGNKLDRKSLVDVIDSLERLRIASPHGEHSRLTILGEMAVPLYRSGNIEAAVELEQIWSELTKPLPFLTVCCYPMECFENGVGGKSFPSVCAEHAAINHA
jgi:hypothetical protein